MITAITTSQLYNVRKYGNGSSLQDRYLSSTDPSENGVDFSQSVVSGNTFEIVYYIDGFKYIELSGETNQTIVEYESVGYSDNNNFNELNLIKDESRQLLTNKPRVNSDVNITRQSLSVFDKLYRLESINKLSDLLYYGGGNVFNIKNNI